jgi:hypothetical protein
MTVGMVRIDHETTLVFIGRGERVRCKGCNCPGHEDLYQQDYKQSIMLIPIVKKKGSIISICPFCKTKETVKKKMFSSYSESEELSRKLDLGKELTKEYYSGLPPLDKNKFIERLNQLGQYSIVGYLSK